MFTRRIFSVFVVSLITWGSTIAADDLSTSGDWVYFADTVMGGKSTGVAERINVDGRAAIKLSGIVTTENNGGFVQVRREIKLGQASDFEGLSFETKGNGDTYYIHIRNGSSRLPWQFYSTSFQTSGEWQKVKIPFSSFERSGTFMARLLNRDTVNSIGLVAYGKEHKALVLVSKLSFY